MLITNQEKHNEKTKGGICVGHPPFARRIVHGRQHQEQELRNASQASPTSRVILWVVLLLPALFHASGLKRKPFTPKGSSSARERS